MDPELLALLQSFYPSSAMAQTQLGKGDRLPFANVPEVLPNGMPDAGAGLPTFVPPPAPPLATPVPTVSYTPPPSLGASLEPYGPSKPGMFESLRNLPGAFGITIDPRTGSGPAPTFGETFQQGMTEGGFLPPLTPPVPPAIRPFGGTISDTGKIPRIAAGGEGGYVPPPPPPSLTPGSVVQPEVQPDQTPAPADTSAQIKPLAQVGGNKLIDALRGVVAPKPPDVQRPIPTREVQPHKIESTIAMLASLGITPKDLMHIPSLGQSLRG